MCHVERADRHKPGAIAFTLGSDDDVHEQLTPSPPLDRALAHHNANACWFGAEK
jgi:hypothetical protein